MHGDVSANADFYSSGNLIHGENIRLQDCFLLFWRVSSDLESDWPETCYAL